MRMLKDFVLKSRKIYVILGAGIMLCVCILTANISYDMGQRQAATKQIGYSEEYVQQYAANTWAYMFVFPEATLSDGMEYGKRLADFSLMTREQMLINMRDNYNRAMKEN